MHSSFAVGARRAAIAAAAAVLLFAPAAPAHSAEPLPADWQKSFNFTSWTADGYASDSAGQALSDMRALGTNQIVLTPTWYMDTATSTAVAPDPAKTPSDASLRTAMSRARGLGMSVALKLHVDVRDGTFRGNIAPTDRIAWFRSYGGMLAHYADLGRRNAVATLVVGTELTSMATDTQQFDVLIAQARAQFPGPLTYAANGIDDAQQIGFWDRLDTIGIDAYTPLDTGNPAPSVAQLTAAWQPYIQTVAALQATLHRPVVFTELGYQSRTGALDAPAAASGAPDARLQAVAYAAALNAWRDVPWFRGISWWNWEAQPTGEDPAASFAIAGKPAAEVVRSAQGGTGVATEFADPGAPARMTAGALLLLALLAGGGLMLYARHGYPSHPAGTAPRPAPAAPRLALRATPSRRGRLPVTLGARKAAGS